MTTTARKISSLGAIRTMLKVGACSEAVMNVVDRAFGASLEAEEHASSPLAGGLAMRGHQCGMVWGGALAAGAEAHRRLGAGAAAEAAAVNATASYVEAFRQRLGSLDCRAISRTDWRRRSDRTLYFLRGGPLKCFGMCPGCSRLALEEIDSALSEEPEAIGAPASCASLLVRELGWSERHAVTVAGLAGGVGLSGGGCGALGAAVWLTALADPGDDFFRAPESSAVAKMVEAFEAHTGGRHLCSELAGRRFADVAEHGRYLRGGGCARLLELLSSVAAPGPSTAADEPSRAA